MQGTCKEEIIKIAVLIIGAWIAEHLGRCFVDKWLRCRLNFKSVFFPSSITSGKGDDLYVKKKWEKAISTKTSATGGKLLGSLERFAFVSAFCFFEKDSYLLIGGWLAFKIAAKWEAWGHIHKFPEKFTSDPDILEELQARNEIGSITLSRFLIGTLGNILVGYFGFYLAETWS